MVAKSAVASIGHRAIVSPGVTFLVDILVALHEMPSPSSDWTARQPHARRVARMTKRPGTDRCGQERLRGPAALATGQAMSDTTSSGDEDTRSAVQRAVETDTWMGGWTMSMSAPASAAKTWGPYFDAEFGPPHRVRSWIAWKISSTGVNIARRRWDQREELRQAYGSVHGTDPDRWPARHPGVVLDAVLWVAHAACLGCQWIDKRGYSMREPDELDGARSLAHRHQVSNGVFLDGPRSLGSA